MPKSNIAKNTVIFIAALVLQKILALVFFVFIARVGGGQVTGDYVGALSYTAIFGIFLDLGLSQLLIREVAKNNDQGTDYLNNVISAKIVFALVVYGLLVMTIQILTWLHYGHPNTTMVLIAGVVMVIDSFVLSLQATLRGYQNLFYEALITVLSKIVIVVLGISGSLLNFPSIIFVSAILGGSLFSLVSSFYFLKRKYNFHFKFNFNKDFLIKSYQQAWPFAVLGFFSSVYAQVDVVILSIIKGSEVVGLYSVPAKTMSALQFIPMAFAAALYPAMSKNLNNRLKLREIFEQGFIYLTLLSLPIAAGLFILAEPIIITAYTETYRPAVLSLQILAPSLFFAFLTFPIGSLLNASSAQKINTLNMGIVMAINFFLNLLVIPTFSFIGSSVVWTVTNVAWFVLSLFWAGRLIDYSKKLLIMQFLKALVATVAMTLILFITRDKWPLLINIAFGGSVYLIVLILIKGLTVAEIKKLFFLLKAKDSSVDNSNNLT